MRRRRVRLQQVARVDAVLVVGPLPRSQDEIAAVLAHRRAESPGRLVRPLVDQHVGGLRRADAMVIDLLIEVQRLERLPRLRLGIAAIEEAAAVVRPRGAAELRPLELVGQDRARGDFHQPPDVPVRTRFRDRIGDVAAVVAERRPAERDRPVLRPGVRVDQDLRIGIERLLDVEDRLVLQAVVLEETVASAGLERAAVLRIVPQLREPFLDRRPLGDRVEIAVRDGVLGRDPVGDLLAGADVVLQPAVGVGDGGAVIDVRLLDLPRLGIAEAAGVGGERKRHEGDQQRAGHGDSGRDDGGGFNEREESKPLSSQRIP